MGQNNSNFELASEARRAAERCESLPPSARTRTFLPFSVVGRSVSRPSGRQGTSLLLQNVGLLFLDEELLGTSAIISTQITRFFLQFPRASFFSYHELVKPV